MTQKSASLNLDNTPRIWLFYFAVLTQLIASGISGTGFVLNSPVFLLAGTTVWIFWFFMIFAVLLPGTDRFLITKTPFIKKGAKTIFIFICSAGILELITIVIIFPHFIGAGNTQNKFNEVLDGLNRVFQYNDGTALSQQATENLLAGKNPYSNANLIGALLEYKGAYDRVTPLRLGPFAPVFPYPDSNLLKQEWEKAILNPSHTPPELESRVCYPAGSFLLPAPFVFFGIHDIRIIYAIFVVAAMIYTVLQIPKRRRLLFIGAAMISLELWNSIAGGETGSLSFALLLVAWVSLNKNVWLSAIFMGFAIATKQTAWFFVPFYLVLLFRTREARSLLPSLAIMAVIFAAMNIPFAIGEPKLWFESMMSPMTDPMFPIGGGFVTLVISGVVNIQKSTLFTIMEILVFIAAITWYFKYCLRYPQTGPVLAIVPLFFAWRSLWSYFFYVAIISLAYILVNEPDPTQNNTRALPLVTNTERPK